MTDWIKIEPGCKMPEHMAPVYCWDGKFVTSGFYIYLGQEFLSEFQHYIRGVTHWTERAVPEPPEDTDAN